MDVQRVIVAFGGNLDSVWGSPRETFNRAAIRMAENGVIWQGFSPLYRTAPIPAGAQPWFLNAVAVGESALAPHDLLAALLALEDEAGRVRQRRNEARPLDLDLIDHGGRRIGQPGDRLTLPHPRLHERAFVLRPLADLLPDWRHPAGGQTIASLLTAPAVAAQQIEWLSADW